MVVNRQGGWVIVASFIVALVLAIIPLPDWLDRFRPDWVGLAIIYWCMAIPHRVNVGTGWIMGLFLDAAQSTLLGQHALALAVVAFLAVRTHRRIRVLPLWQQTLGVFFFLSVNQLLIAWINGIMGYSPRGWWYLAPALGGMIVWPWVYTILRALRRRFQVS